MRYRLVPMLSQQVLHHIPRTGPSVYSVSEQADQGWLLFYFWRSWTFVNVCKAATQPWRPVCDALCIGKMAQRPPRCGVPGFE